MRPSSNAVASIARTGASASRTVPADTPSDLTFAAYAFTSGGPISASRIFEKNGIARRSSVRR